MGLLDYLSGKTETITRHYSVLSSNGNGDATIHYVLRKLLKGKKIVDKYWQKVDSEGNPVPGSNAERKMQCIPVQDYRNLVQRSQNVQTVQSVQTDLERLAEKTTPEYAGEGVLVRIVKKSNQWAMVRLGNAKLIR
jgi:hypothetical protein